MPDSQTVTLVVSIIGAAAWLPPIIKSIMRICKRPKLTVFPSRLCNVGFTELGPIFNINIAITADNSDILIRNVNFNIKHLDTKAEYNFVWHEILESKETIYAYNLKVQPAIHESETIALKVADKDFKTVF